MSDLFGNLNIKKCKRCGDEYEPEKLNQQICSKEHFQKCENCGGDYPWEKRGRTCSKECASELRKKTSSYDLTCEWCGEEFQSTQINAKFCKRDHFSDCVVCKQNFKISSVNRPSKTCSPSCSSALSHTEDAKENRKIKSLERYGVSHTSKREDVKEKIRENHKNNPNVVQVGSDDFKKKMLDKFGSENYFSTDEHKKAMSENNPMKDRSTVEKQKESTRKNNNGKEAWQISQEATRAKYGVSSPRKIHIKNIEDYENMKEFFLNESNKSNELLDMDFYADYFKVHPTTLRRKIEGLNLEALFTFSVKKSTQFDLLVERKDEVIKDIFDESLSREEFLKKYNCSTRALYKFMEIFNLKWVNSKSNIVNKPIKKVVEQRLKVELGEKIDNIVFNSDEKLLNKTGIYRIVSASGGVYIGMASINFKRRFYSHRMQLNNGDHHCRGLQRAFNNDPNMSFEIIEVIDEKEKIPLREKEIWNAYKDRNIKLYNGEPSGTLSVFHTEETKALLSKDKIDSYIFTEEEIEEIHERLIVDGQKISTAAIQMKVGVNRVKRLVDEKQWDLSIEARIERNRDEIIRLAKSYMPFREIAKVVRIPRDNIYNFLMSENIVFVR